MLVGNDSGSEADTGTCSQEQAWGYKLEKRGAKIVANCVEEVEAVLETAACGSRRLIDVSD